MGEYVSPGEFMTQENLRAYVSIPVAIAPKPVSAVALATRVSPFGKLLTMRRRHFLTLSAASLGGVLVFSVALVMLGLKRIELTDYLPSLLFSPLLTWLWP